MRFGKHFGKSRREKHQNQQNMDKESMFVA